MTDAAMICHVHVRVSAQQKRYYFRVAGLGCDAQQRSSGDAAYIDVCSVVEK